MTILTNTNEIRKAVKAELKSLEETKEQNPEQLFSIPQVAKKLNKDWRTIKRMVDENRLRATADKRYISQKAITDYINGISQNQ